MAQDTTSVDLASEIRRLRADLAAAGYDVSNITDEQIIQTVLMRYMEGRQQARRSGDQVIRGDQNERRY